MSLYKTYNRIRFFFSLWGTRNWYEGIDKPNLWQWIYKWRISPSTAWSVSSSIWGNEKPKQKSPELLQSESTANAPTYSEGDE